MATLIARISYFGSGGTGNEVVLTDWTRLVIKRGLDAKSNTVEIRLKNSIKKRLSDGTTLHKYVNDDKVLSLDNTTALAQGDAIKIWLRWADSASDTITYNDTSSSLITVSEVQEWEFISEEGKTPFVIQCVDKTYEVLNKLYVSAYTKDVGLTCPTMAQAIIQRVTGGIKGGYNDAGTIVFNGHLGVDARVMSGTYAQQAALDVAATGTPPAYIEGLRIDESAYDIISMTKIWKPVYEWLKEINSMNNTNSAAEITAKTWIQDRNNRFYIDQNNRYHQFYPSDSVNYDITAGTNDPDGTVTDFKIKKKTFDIINMVIFNAGKDLDGVGVLWYYFDKASKERKLKMKYIPMLEIASEGNGSLRALEVLEGNISIAADGIVTILNASGTTSWGTTYSDAADYKTKFRTKAKTEGEARAIALTINRGNPRLKGGITVKKGATYVAGQLTKFTALSHGINQELLRITDVTHQITPNQWVSQLELEEDEPKFSEQA